MKMSENLIEGTDPTIVLVQHARIVTPMAGTAASTSRAAGIADGWMLLRGGRIAAIGVDGEPLPELPEDALRIDAHGGYALAGFIDIHVHGGAGHDFMTAGAAELDAITRFHAEHGTTAMLATTVTASREALTGVLQRVSDYRQTSADGSMPYAQLLGVHLEGPFMNAQWKGAQNAAYMVKPQLEWLDRWVHDYPGVIKLQTLAPETDGASAYIERLVQHGILAACGHTDATYEQLRAAADRGLTHAVHTFNAMRPLHHREPGTVGAVLTDNRIMAEIIADGEHVHPAAIRVLLQAKGIDSVMLVTDAVAAAGMPDGDYELGELPVIVEGGIARLKDDRSLAGSTLTTVQGFRYLVETVGVTIEEASRMASLNPARQLGIAGDYGSLEPGKRADVLLLDSRLQLQHVLIGGRVVL
jgi:N-acetylglucosamine-6-phosphate deacetylase